MPSTSSYALVVAVHAINAVTCLGEHKLVDAIMTCSAFEAVRVVAVVAGHDSLVEDGLMADTTRVRAIGTDGLAVGEEE